jgi:hypothetical protein
MADEKMPKGRMDELVAYVITNRVDDVRQLLTRNGFADAPALATEDVQVAFLKAIKDSASFRDDVSEYLSALVQDMSSENASFVQQPNLNLFGADDISTMNTTAGAGSTTPTTTTTQKSSFWSTLGGVASKENLSKLFNTGLDTLSTKLKNDANKASEERALELERLRLQQLQTQKEITGSGGAPTKKGMPGWAIGLIVVGGLGLVGTVLYFALRKK